MTKALPPDNGRIRDREERNETVADLSGRYEAIERVAMEGRELRQRENVSERYRLQH